LFEDSELLCADAEIHARADEIYALENKLYILADIVLYNMCTLSFLSMFLGTKNAFVWFVTGMNAIMNIQCAWGLPISSKIPKTKKSLKPVKNSKIRVTNEDPPT